MTGVQSLLVGEEPFLKPGTTAVFAGPSIVNDAFRQWLGYSVTAEAMLRFLPAMRIGRRPDFDERRQFLFKLGRISDTHHNGLLHDIKPGEWFEDDVTLWDENWAMRELFGRGLSSLRRPKPRVVVVDEPGDARPELWQRIADVAAKGNRSHKPWDTTVVELTSQLDVEGAVKVEPLEMLQPGPVGMWVIPQFDRRGNPKRDEDGEQINRHVSGTGDLAKLTWPSGHTDKMSFLISDDGRRKLWPAD